MLNDRYDNAISTTSTQARDHYIDGLDRLLAGDAGVGEAFEAAVAADEGFALGYCGLARYQQICGNAKDARSNVEKALTLVSGVSAREAAHVEAMNLLTSGQVGKAYQLIREHLNSHPRDALLAQTCTSVFGLIGFSGQPGREAELLAYTESLMPHYEGDWWFLCQHAFSLCETGQLDRAGKLVDESLRLKPRCAHAAHVRAHVYYEAGEIDSGAQFLDDWLPGFTREAYLHCHISWHVALWALQQGKTDKFWQVVNDAVMPNGAWGPPLNVLTDAAAILYRADLAGESVPPAMWHTMSEYASRYFPKPGLAFADVHAAICHAMAGNGEALERIVSDARGPAADVVSALASGFRALATQDWQQASQHLVAGMTDHARIGGSRAQRDLLEFGLVSALLRQGAGDYAGMMLSLRRPVHDTANPVSGLARH